MALQVWLPLNGNLNNQGLLNGNFTISTTPTYIDSGKIGKALNSGAFSMSAEQTNNLLNNNYFSICFWIYINASNGTSAITTIFGNGNMTAPNNRRFTLYHYPTVNQLHLSWQNYDSNGDKVGYVSGIDFLPSYQWTHVAVTYNNSKREIKIYKNGSLYHTISNAYQFTNPNYSYITQLISNDSRRYLNDYRIYDHCLSPKEVKEISKGLVLHYKLDSLDSNGNLVIGLVNGGQTSISGNTINISGSNSDTYFFIKTSRAMTSGKTYKISCIGNFSNNNIYYNFPIAAQSNSSPGVLNVKNGYCELIFIANDVCQNAGTQIILDDNGRNPGVGSIINIKLEEVNTIYDCSGYKHNSIIQGKLTENIDSPRYNKCLKNIDGYICKTNENMYFPVSYGLTITCWIYLTLWGAQQSGIWATSNDNSSPSDYNTTACNHRDGGFDIRGTNGVTYRLSCSGSDIPVNNWRHVAFTHDGSTAKLYINGILVRSLSVPTSLVAFNYIFLGYSCAGSLSRKCQGNWSDFRVYCTALSDTDIKELYDTAASIDNQGNMFSFEFDEEEINKPQVLKTGLSKTNSFIEINDKIKILSDGSAFIQILHHNAPSSNLFNSVNCWLNNTSNLYSLTISLKTIFKNLSNYEFLVCEKLESSSSESQIRWRQTSNPALSSTLSGYTLISGSAPYGAGLMNKGNYGCFHNGNTWWCCCGSYTSYNGGIPGFTGVIKSGYLDLYIRIPQEMLKGNIGAFTKFFSKSILSTQFIEK